MSILPSYVSSAKLLYSRLNFDEQSAACSSINKAENFLNTVDNVAGILQEAGDADSRARTRSQV